ncbi:MAG: lysylphosphatidylglycerol synthase transmembrane domain-containing protein [Sulfuricaulis sp.]
MKLFFKESNKAIFLAIKLIVTAGSICWILTLINLKIAWQSITAVPISNVLLAIILMLASYLMGSIRWWLLLRHAVNAVHYTRILSSYFLGIFFNNILPTTMGGDVARTLHLSIRGINTKALIGSALIDRAIGLFTTLVFGLICISLSSEIALNYRDRLILLGATIIGTMGIFIFFSTHFLKLTQRMVAAYQHTRIRKFLLETIQLCHSYKSAWVSLLAATGLTVLIQSAVIAAYYLLGKTIGITLSPITYFGIIPLVFLAGAVPISLGGIGVRESVLVGLLVILGVNTQLAITLSLLYLFVLLVSSIPGALVMLSIRLGKDNS